MFTPSDNMATAISAAAEKAGEKFWRMPIVDSYKEGLKSNIADMKNTGPRLDRLSLKCPALIHVCMYDIVCFPMRGGAAAIIMLYFPL